MVCVCAVGDHGYDNQLVNMHPIFIAHGPAFKKAYKAEPFDSVDVYPLLCHLLDVEPRPNNGSLDVIRHILAGGDNLNITMITCKSFSLLSQRFICRNVPCGRRLDHRTLTSWKAASDRLVEKVVKYDSWPIQPDILSPPLLRLTSRKPLWLDLQPVDIKSRWRHDWKSA